MAAGNHCTAFDTNGYLPNLYGKYGYRPIARVAFDPKQAPENWKKEMGTPDVVVMVNDPDGVTGAPEVKGDYQNLKPKVPLVSYEKAVAIQKKAVAKVERKAAESEKGLANVEKGWLRQFKQDQRAFEKTGKLGLRHDAVLTGERAPAENLRDYMSMIAEWQRRNLKEHGIEDVRYGGPQDFILSEGKEYDVPDKPPQIRLMAAKECYSNSTRMMLDNAGKYNYAEGYYVSPHLPFPIEHAWLVDKKRGTVVDPTLGWQPKGRYYGVAYPKKFVIRKMLENKYYGLHSNGEMANPLVMGTDKDFNYGKKRST